MSAGGRRAGSRRANDLDGRTWTRHSISIWSDLKKTPEEMALGHPAMFPEALPARLIDCFTTAADRLILDPFAGVGSTLLAASSRGKGAVGIELSVDFAARASERLAKAGATGGVALHVGDARHLERYVSPSSIDLVVTSPPYWDILLRPRTADQKAIRHYGSAEADLGRIAEYDDFLDTLEAVFGAVRTVLRPGAYCCVVVMDVRKQATFYPLHIDLAVRLQRTGFLFDDLIIWDRRHEYNHFRPLGFPAVFRINRAHEYVLIFQKPQESARRLPELAQGAEGVVGARHGRAAMPTERQWVYQHTASGADANGETCIYCNKPIVAEAHAGYWACKPEGGGPDTQELGFYGYTHHDCTAKLQAQLHHDPRSIPPPPDVPRHR